jgi:hypothetical protein
MNWIASLPRTAKSLIGRPFLAEGPAQSASLLALPHPAMPSLRRRPWSVMTHVPSPRTEHGLSMSPIRSGFLGSP